MANRSDIVSANGKRYKTTGPIPPYRINNLDASKITSGMFDLLRMPEVLQECADEWDTVVESIDSCMKQSPITVTDLNSATEIGFYTFASTASNRPTEIFTSGGALLVLKYSGNYLTQIAVANTFTRYELAIRKYRQGTFSAWKPLLLETEQTHYPKMEVGGISVSTGLDTSSTSATGKARMRTPLYRPYLAGTNVTPASGYEFKFLLYDANQGFVEPSEDWLSSATTVPECGYFRILAKNDSITDFTGATNDFLTITDTRLIPERLEQIFATLDVLGGDW